MANEDTAFLGHWWRPGEDQQTDRQPGRLVLGSDNSAELELLGGFPPQAEMPSGEEGRSNLRSNSPFKVVFGQSGSACFTLLDVTALNSVGSAVSRPDRQTLSPQRTIRGDMFVSEPDAEVIEGVSLQIDFLLFFSQLTALEDGERHHVHEVGETRSSASVVIPDKLEAHWRDVSFTIELDFTDFLTKVENPNLQRLAATQRAELDIRFATPRSIAETDQISKKVQDLLTLALDRPCATRAASYKVARPEPRNEWERSRAQFAPEFNLTVHGRQIYQPDTDPYREPGIDYIFTTRHVAFAEMIPRWFDLYEKANIGIQMLSGSRYLSVGYVSSRLATVCIGLEAIHSTLYDEPRMSQEEFDQFLTSALAGVDNDDHRKLIEQMLTNRMSYRRRAKGLISRLPEDVRKAVFGKPRLWIDMVTAARNDLAHANSRDRTSGEQLFLMLITQFVLSLVLAKELGVSDDRLREFVGHSWGLTERWREVTGQLRQSQRTLPGGLGEAATSASP